MAELSYPCSITQAFSFEKDKQLLVGHLAKLKVGTVQLAEDTKLADPTSTSYATTALVAPISSLYWGGGFGDPIIIGCNVSTENQQSVSMLAHTNLQDTTVKVQLFIYAFDQVAKVYYKAFMTGASADSASEFDGLILKQDGNLVLSIASDNDKTVPAPLNYEMRIAIMPKAKDGIAFQFAVSNTAKLVKKWGIQGGASGST